MYIEGDVPTVTTCGNSGNNGWGNDWSWIIGLAVIGALFGNGNGFGFGGGRGGENAGWQMGRLATTNDIASGFSTSEIMSDLNDIILGQTQGFAGVNNAICTLGYQNQAGFNALGTQLAQCCCETRSAIADVKYANERNASEIINNANANTRAILDYLTGEKIAALQAENSGLKAQISNDRQSAYLLNELKPCPIPAYITCNPSAPYGLGYGVGFGVSTCGNCASVQ